MLLQSRSYTTKTVRHTEWKILRLIITSFHCRHKAESIISGPL